MTFDYEWFKQKVYSMPQIDLNAYKERQMKRRIDTLIAKNKYSGYDTYVAGLTQDQSLFEEFVNYLTINVSEFYRNPEQWRLLTDEVYPMLMERFGKQLKIWSAACSTGDEPYSLVMSLSKYIPINQIRIFATDIDKQVLAKAKVGLYTGKSIEAVPDIYKAKYFQRVGSSEQISEEVKRCVEFKQHNLLKDTYPTNCHLIVCRNVLIYFTEEAKEEIFKRFYDALCPGGILFIGSTEQIVNYKEIGFIRNSSFFYQKPL